MQRYFVWYDGDGQEQMSCCVNQQEVDALLNNQDISYPEEIDAEEYFNPPM